MGKVYVVQLHTGEWAGITLRARRIIGGADLIIVSDPARSNAVEVGSPQTIVLQGRDPEGVARQLQSVLQTGDVAWLVPQIVQWSSRETQLLHALLRHGVDVESVPGPSSLVAALVASGLPCVRFSFLGEMPSSPAQRREALHEIEFDRNTLVFAVRESKADRVLNDVRSVLGDRQMVLSQAFADDGSAYLIIAGATDEPSWSEGQVRDELGELLANHLSTRDAVELVSQRSRWRKRAVYKMALEIVGR
jgi:16S rRNA (cytidine1402-2'-O)-methyltransferase